MDTPPILQVEKLEKVYGETRAVDGLDLELLGGEVLGLLGPNGAGKTTTLRCIAGVLAPTAGTIRVAGFDLESSPLAAKRLLAYVPDDPKLFENLTCREHIRFIAEAYRVTDFRERAAGLLERFELEEKSAALASELSRGMRQKLAAVCALLHDPRLLLLDEPMTGLDPRGIRTMNELIAERAAAGAAVIVSSHLLAMVERIASKILVVHRGQTLLFGGLETLRQRFPELSSDASLEELFFRATESVPGGAADAEGPSP